ncbi:MAG: RDD family protein [Ilumatobacteraceae bacterium]
MSEMPPPPPPPPPPSPGASTAPHYAGQQSWVNDAAGRAGFGARLGAYLLDVVLYGLAMIVPVVAGVLVILLPIVNNCVSVAGSADLICPPGVPSGSSIAGGIALIVVGVLGVMFIYVRAEGKTGQTWGRKIVGIKVVRVSDGLPPGFWRALGRELFGNIISGQIFYLGYLWMIWDKDRQTWHDKVAGTVVVKV